MTIGTMYSRSNEESVEAQRLQKGPVLESRNAVAVVARNNSRADRVQVKKCDLVRKTKTPTALFGMGDCENDSHIKQRLGFTREHAHSIRREENEERRERQICTPFGAGGSGPCKSIWELSRTSGIAPRF
ncbi:hypothetical protein EVAR_14713_1 [Eumeta japonica]|uniref:Uncharacterized protein n=1 Tax=Eumeta variegata TaxID=151549 RepID=A0A4C1U328_EUMVA|nr:hypothetical protein EVAR_14713_1 [Eumeta japonica]